MKQGQDLGCAAAHVFVRLGGRSPSCLPRHAGMRHGLKWPGLVLTPDREPKLCTKRVGLLDQLFFAAALGWLVGDSADRRPPRLRGRSMPGCHITDRQVRRYMASRKAGYTQAASAARAGFSDSTARRVERAPVRPSQRPPRQYRTRVDPFQHVWRTEVVPLLERAPGI